MAASNREIGKAGWGWTAFVSVISLVYFFPVLWIILTAFKTRTDALAIPPKLFFSPTLENFTSVFYRASITAGAAQETNFPLYFFNSIFIVPVNSVNPFGVIRKPFGWTDIRRNRFS